MSRSPPVMLVVIVSLHVVIQLSMFMRYNQHFVDFLSVLFLGLFIVIFVGSGAFLVLLHCIFVYTHFLIS